MPYASAVIDDPSTGDDALEAIVVDALDRLPGRSSASVSARWPSSSRTSRAAPSSRPSGRTGCSGCTRASRARPYGADQAAYPSKITLFRGPLTRTYRSASALAAGVTETVYHEIAHHFGISDARLHELRGGR